jgi:hypothetical protein
LAAALRFNIGVPPPLDPDALNSTQLKELVVQLLAEVAALKQTVMAQREEITRLKGLKGPPDIKPSGMERATAPPSSKPGSGPSARQRRGAHRSCHRAGRVALQGLRELSGAGAGAVSAGHPLPARALGHARWPDHPRAIAGGHRRSFRP